MIADGTWKLPKVNQDTLINIFISKSMYHSHYKVAFKNLATNHPTMLRWVQNGDDKPGDVEVWGIEKRSYSIGDLKDWVLKQGDFAVAESSKKGKSGKPTDAKGSKDKKKKKTK